FRRQRDRFRRAREDAAPARELPAVVVVPARARPGEEARPLGEARGGVRVRVDEDMPVIEGGLQADVPRQQHAVAEHVSRHVADADDGEIHLLRVDAELAEVPLDALPAAARGDAHFLVVVAGGAARGEGIAQPEPVLGRDGVGDVGEGRGALVGGHHQVRIIADKGTATFSDIANAISEKVAVPLSAATTRYGSSPSWRTRRGGGTIRPARMLSVRSRRPRMKVW